MADELKGIASDEESGEPSPIAGDGKSNPHDGHGNTDHMEPKARGVLVAEHPIVKDSSHGRFSSIYKAMTEGISLFVPIVESIASERLVRFSGNEAASLQKIPEVRPTCGRRIADLAK